MLFNYSTIDVSLLPSLKGMVIEFNNEKNSYLTLEKLFEIDGVLNWLKSHIEVNFILFKGTNNQFGHGVNLESFSETETLQLEQYSELIRTMITKMINLPQIFISLLEGEVQGASLEIAMASDLRFSLKDTTLDFSYIKNGLCPGHGLITHLTNLVGKSHLQNWLYTNQSVDENKMKDLGIIIEILADQSEITPYLANIVQSSQTARIQLKGQLAVNDYQEDKNKLEKEFNLANGQIQVEDWRRFKKNNSFISAKEWSAQVKNQIDKEA